MEAVATKAILRLRESSSERRVTEYYDLWLDDKKIGNVWLQRYDAFTLISNLAIFPPFQGKGYGKQMMLQIITLTEGKLKLRVYADNDVAISLYSQFGFFEIPRKKRKFEGAKEILTFVRF